MPRLSQNLAFPYPEALEGETEDTFFMGFRNMMYEFFPQISVVFISFKKTYYMKKKEKDREKKKSDSKRNRRQRIHNLN